MPVSEPSCTGEWASALEPLPTWPLELSPQAQTWPLASSASTCSRPPAISVIAGRPGTAPKENRLAEEPLPSWPSAFVPAV